MKKALVIGATGLVGRQLICQLAEADAFNEIVCFVRRSGQIKLPGVAEMEVDFRNPEIWSDQLRGDVLFSCLGTTIRKAGSQAAQFEVDYTFQYETARRASENGVRQLVLISSAGADSKSRLFYSRTKGQLDEAVKDLGFERISILRPSILDGERRESRTGERIGLAVMKILGHLPGIRKYRPISGSTVARAMIQAAILPNVDRVYIIYELEDVHRLAGEK